MAFFTIGFGIGSLVSTSRSTVSSDVGPIGTTENFCSCFSK